MKNKIVKKRKKVKSYEEEILFINSAIWRLVFRAI